MRRYVIIGLSVFALECGTARAVLMQPAPPPAVSASVVERPDTGREPTPSWNWNLAAVTPPRGFAERVLTFPNIAIVLTGMAWMVLVRRQQGARRRA